MIYFVSYILNGFFQMVTCWTWDDVTENLLDVQSLASQGHGVSNLTIKSSFLYK